MDAVKDGWTWYRVCWKLVHFWPSRALIKLTPRWWSRAYFVHAQVQEPGQPPVVLIFAELIPALLDLVYGFSFYHVRDRMQRTYPKATVAVLSWSPMRAHEARRMNWECVEGVRKGENPWGAMHERRTEEARRRQRVKPVEDPK